MTNRLLVLILIACCAAVAITLPSCSAPRPAALPVPPAAADVAELTARENAARLAAATAAAQGKATEAEYQRRLADEISPLRRTAEDRQRTQQLEVEAIATRERATARDDAEAEQLVKDRRRSMYGLAGCAAVLVALLVIGAPPLLAIGLPAAVATGLIVLAGLSSVPWLATAIGLTLACLVLIALAALAVYVARAWRRHADDAAARGRPAADAASLASQPRFLRPIITRLLGGQP